VHPIRVSTLRNDPPAVSTHPTPPFDVQHRSPYLLHEREKVPAQERIARRLPPVETDLSPLKSGAGHLLERAACDRPIPLAPPVVGSEGTKELFGGRRPVAFPGPSMPAWEPKWCEWQRGRSLLDVIGKPWTRS
jgi:hypothetical protein